MLSNQSTFLSSKWLQSIYLEILTYFYGFGTLIPGHFEGSRVFDIDCGTDRDVYILCVRVGIDVFVTGIDITEKQLDVAKRHVDYQNFGLNKVDVEFK